MNRIWVIRPILILYCSVSLASCTPSVASPAIELSSTTPCSFYQAADEGTASLSSCSIPALTKEGIVESLFDVWLNKYKAISVPAEDRLDDYKVNSVDVLDDPSLAQSRGVDFVAKVKYSVRPTVQNAQRWILEDGIVYNNSDWIWYKGYYVGIKNLNDIYQLRLLGRCPTC